MSRDRNQGRPHHLQQLAKVLQKEEEEKKPNPVTQRVKIIMVIRYTLHILVYVYTQVYTHMHTQSTHVYTHMHTEHTHTSVRTHTHSMNFNVPNHCPGSIIF